MMSGPGVPWELQEGNRVVAEFPPGEVVLADGEAAGRVVFRMPYDDRFGTVTVSAIGSVASESGDPVETYEFENIAGRFVRVSPTRIPRSTRRPACRR